MKEKQLRENVVHLINKLVNSYEFKKVSPRDRTYEAIRLFLKPKKISQVSKELGIESKQVEFLLRRAVKSIAFSIKYGEELKIKTRKIEFLEEEIGKLRQEYLALKEEKLAPKEKVFLPRETRLDQIKSSGANISRNTLSRLARVLGARTVGDIQKFSHEELRKTKGFGGKSLKELEEFLSENNILLKN